MKAERTPLEIQGERDAIREVYSDTYRSLMFIAVLVLIGLLSYQTFRTPKQLSTLQVCAHKKEAINANTFENDLQKKWIEEVSCQPVRYFDDINNSGSEIR